MPPDGPPSADANSNPTQVLFYHLEHQPLERVLPNLVERALARGWKCVIQAGSQERLDAIDLLLWTYSEESFLAHGQRRAGHPEWQPVFLTTAWETPNNAGVRFLVDGAKSDAFSGFVRLVYLFDGHDEEAVALARQEWKAAKAAGCGVEYWQAGDDGRWARKA